MASISRNTSNSPCAEQDHRSAATALERCDSATNDPSIVSERRTGNRAHLAWSAGPHGCPAQREARIIASVAIERLLDRLPDLELAVPAEELVWQAGPFHRALMSLPVTFPPVAPLRSALPPETSHSITGEPRWTSAPTNGSTSSIPQGPTSPARQSPAPATPVELPGQVVAWSVGRIDVLKRLLTDPRVSKDPRQHWPAYAGGEIPQDWQLFAWISVNNMFTAYGGDHRRLRRLISPAFTARRVAGLQPRVEAITADLIESLAARPAGEPVDLREEYAYPVPLQVICELFGVPEEQRPLLRKAVDGVFDTSFTPEEAFANYQLIYGCLRELVAYKRARPGDDMTSLLITVRDEDDGAGLKEDELVDTLLLVLGAGHETTVNLIDNAVHAMLTRPEQLELVRSGRASWSDVIEEALRFRAPVAHLPLRYAVEDIDVDGVTIPKGSPILANYAGAGLDRGVHGETAGDFDVLRADKEHLAFGHGVHFCLGAPLARMEAELALPALFDRFPGMRLAVPEEELRPGRRLHLQRPQGPAGAAQRLTRGAHSPAPAPSGRLRRGGGGNVAADGPGGRTLGVCAEASRPSGPR